MHEQKFIVRIPETTHIRLKRMATKLQVSMNQVCVDALLLPGQISSLDAETKSAVRTLSCSYPDLIAIVAFGSWARGQMTDESDIDLLVVLDPSVKITRETYRQWEKNSPKNSRVEPSIVVLPDDTKRVSGLWAEAAVSGIVLADSDLRLQRYLKQVRQLVAEGKIVCKRVHGQNYWVHAEVA